VSARCHSRDLTNPEAAGSSPAAVASIPRSSTGRAPDCLPTRRAGHSLEQPARRVALAGIRPAVSDISRPGQALPRGASGAPRRLRERTRAELPN